MCGILGYIGTTTDLLFQKALDKILHRGPDGQGTWKSQNIWLGHRRLAIIDLSEKAKQPMSVLNRFHIILNGEIYNYKELRAELKKEFIFQSESDTEVLLYAYIKWGVDCLNKLNGMWAFAIWDDLQQELFISRDRIGKKPLFYSQLNNDFVFSSEMKGIYPFLNNIEIDPGTFKSATYNSFFYENTEHCLIKGIKRFPAGSYGIYKDEKLKITKYWHPLEEKMAVPIKYSDQVEMFRELFLDACKLRMRSDVTIGTALSGGLDSSATICSMNHIAKTSGTNTDWQHAFVACFPGTSLDETEYAYAVTEHIGIKANFITIDPIIELNDLYRQAYLFEEIYFAPTIPFVQLYKQMKKTGVTVSIDGHGADELFGGYSFDLPTAMIDSLPNIFEAKKIAETYANCFIPPKNDFINQLKYALINRYKALQYFSKSKEKQNKIDTLDFFNSRLFEATYDIYLPTLLRNYDRYSMMNGVEIRMPFLDYRILQFAFSIPYSSKIRIGFTKAIVRDAMQGIVPDTILKRKNKIGFNSPIDAWVKQPKFKEWLLDTMGNQDFLTATCVNPIEVKSKIEKMLNSTNLNFLKGTELFNSIIPYIWEIGLKKYAK